jgi:hypothetical protein
MSRPADAVGLDIAGLRAALVAREPAVPAVARERFRGFVTAGAPDWTIDVATATLPSGRSDDVIVRRDGAGSRFTVGRHDFAATLDLDARRGDVALAPGSDVALDAFVRVTWTLALLERRGLLLHAASLARGDRAFLFCGRSGAGKTTLARLSADAELLSDEVSCVRLTGAGPRAYGTPFFGDLGRPGANRAVPLVAIYFLEHAERHTRESLARPRALARLLTTVLFFGRDATLARRVFDLAAALVETVPCFRLGFRPEPSVWEVIDDA